MTKKFLRSHFRSLSEAFVPVIREALLTSFVYWGQIERQLTFFESVLFHYLDNESLWDIYQLLIPDIFLLGSLVNESDEASLRASSMCLNIWSKFLARSPENLLVLVKPNLRVRLRSYVESTGSRSR